MNLVSVRRAGDLLHVGLDRPSKHNALDDELVAELHALLDTALDTGPVVLVFRSTTPGMFVSGADIARLRERTAVDAAARINGTLFDRIAAFRWPTIAVVDGPALGGGCELAMACDFRVASERATFGQPELRLGIMAGAGGNWRLERLAGLSVARRMLLAGEVLDSSTALASGLVDEVHAVAAVDAAADALASRILRNSWRALELTKEALARAEHSTAEFDMVAQAELFESAEKQRRMGEFLARRARPGEPQ